MQKKAEVFRFIHSVAANPSMHTSKAPRQSNNLSMRISRSAHKLWSPHPARGPLTTRRKFRMLWLAGLLAMALGGAAGAWAQPRSSDGAAALQQARSDYFQALQGNRKALDEAEKLFNALHQQQPRNATVTVYWGSLELLKAGHTLNIFAIRPWTRQGLDAMNAAVTLDPNNVEVRYIRAATEYHLPAFLHTRAQAEQDFAWIAPRAEMAARNGQLQPELAASALDTYGCILLAQQKRAEARKAFQRARDIAPESPGGQDAEHRLRSQMRPSNG